MNVNKLSVHISKSDLHTLRIFSISEEIKTENINYAKQITHPQFSMFLKMKKIDKKDK